MTVHVKSLAFLAALAVWGVSSMKKGPPSAGTRGGKPLIDMAGEVIDKPRQDRITDCIVAIKRDLDDPGSAEFPNLYLNPERFLQDPNGNDTAEVFVFRAKNRFGAYQKINARCSFKNGQMTEALAIPT